MRRLAHPAGLLLASSLLVAVWGKRRHKRPRRIVARLSLALVLTLGAIAIVPPWRTAALTAALLATGEASAPTDLRAVALCAATQRGLGAWLARRIVVPRGRIVSGTLVSAALHGERRPYYVYLPPGYDLPLFRHTRYPVVYLLHGAPGQASDWYWGGNINVVADRLISACRIVPMILVLPDGNGGLARDSQYINRWDGKENDETYLAHDVVDFVDRHFRTLADPRFRAILGLSEGGYGAANLTVRNPDVFGAAVSIAGYFQAEPWEALPWSNPFGPDRAVMRANSPLLRIALLPTAVRHRLHFFIYDGTNDAEYAPGARAFVRQLRQLSVPYIWNTRRDRAVVWQYHNWVYWRQSATDALMRLSALFLAERHQDIMR
jgi:S-formylglutathione hydrolase FrmB